MTYEDILGSTFGKYSPAGGAANAPIIVPIPVEPENTPQTDFVIEDTVTFDNGGSGRYVTATVAPEGLDAYDNQTVTTAKALLFTGTQSLNMWVTMTVTDGEAEMEMDFTQVDNPDKMDDIDIIVSATLTWDDGGATEDVTITMKADLVLPANFRNYLCFQNVEAVNNTITLEKQGEPTYQVTCEYTKDGENWTVMNLTPDENGICDSIVLQPNEKVWLRGTGTWEFDGTSGSFAQYYFQSTGLLDMSGNLLSIWDKDTFDKLTVMPKNMNMRFLLKYGNIQTYEGWSFLKVRKADLSFDNITKVEQTSANKPNKCVINALFGYTTNVPNTYLQSCKISFNSGIVINRLTGSNHQYSPLNSFFAGCTNLTEIWLPYWTSTGNFNQGKFTDGVPTTGTAYIAQGNNIVRSNGGIPNTWTLKHYDPATGQIID